MQHCHSCGRVRECEVYWDNACGIPYYRCDECWRLQMRRMKQKYALITAVAVVVVVALLLAERVRESL